jgi:glycosyltransferase involved in cell wall biosynthesis
VDDRDPVVVAELIALVQSDEELRAELVRRGTQRVEHYAPERSAVALRAAIERVSSPARS